jgi:DNA-binding transcriptional regulator YiaG
MTPERIKTIRVAAGENTTEFGSRWMRSGRTVEDWEQGRRSPDPMILAALVKLELRQKKSQKKQE